MANRKYIINENGLKSCTGCGIFKNFTDFYSRRDKNGKPYPGGGSKCKECTNNQYNKWAHGNKVYNIKRGKIYRLNQRRKVLDYYGGKCNCCKEENYEFLAIDHIEGNGTQQRKELGEKGRGQNFVIWLINNNFPPGYQVLCHNCNFAKGAYGQCPHQDDYDFSNFIERGKSKENKMEFEFVSVERKSKYKGVTSIWNRWHAHICYDGKKYFLGSFETEEDAARAYDAAAIARLNFPSK